MSLTHVSAPLATVMARLEASQNGGWDYEAYSAAGVLIATFGTEAQAERWFEEEGRQFEGARIERVRWVAEREVVFQQQGRAA